MVHGDPVEQRNPEVGLCSICDHALRRVSAKGGTYWCCDRASSEAAFRRYPALPVEKCAGFEPESPKTGNPTAK